jgi:hypothetical protein
MSIGLLLKSTHVLPFFSVYKLITTPCTDIKLTTNDEFVPSNLTLVQFGFCTGHNISDIFKVGSTFTINIPSKNPVLVWMRLTLTGTVDSEARVPCHSLAPQMCDRNRLKGPMLRLSEGSIRTLRI